MISAQQIKDLREQTGAGISEIKKALEESNGDMDRARASIERRLGANAGKRAGRETRAGVVDAYIHSNARVGVLVELFCETDFVARNPAFVALAHDIALHVAAMNPVYLSQEAVPADIREAEVRSCEEEAKKSGKPAAIQEQIVRGMTASHFAALSLSDQEFVKDPGKTVGQMINEAIGRFGENIRVGKFVRFEL
jgi:elongation factor Ts